MSLDVGNFGAGMAVGRCRANSEIRHAQSRARAAAKHGRNLDDLIVDGYLPSAVELVRAIISMTAELASLEIGRSEADIAAARMAGRAAIDRLDEAELAELVEDRAIDCLDSAREKAAARAAEEAAQKPKTLIFNLVHGTMRE